MLTLKRTYHKRHTEGEILLPDGTHIFTLELPWRDNEPDISCIPEGEYIVDRDFTGKHQYYRLREVNGRTDIEIHPANKVSELNGCIAPCMHLKNGIGMQSTNAVMKLLSLFGNKSFHLRITS